MAAAALRNAIVQAVQTMAIAVERGRLEEENRCHREELLVKKPPQAFQKFSARLSCIRDDERQRLARELQDTTGQQFSAAATDLSILEKTVRDLPLNARQALGEARGLIAQCTQELRTLSYLLHPLLLDAVRLMGALREYSRGFVARNWIAVDLDLSEQPVRFRDDVETSLFRFVPECLTNIHRHAGSTTAQVRLESNASEV